MNWNGKQKAITLSYDDGTLHDIHLVERLNAYGLKSTFNLCSSWLSDERHVSAKEVASLYQGHEVAVHTLTHPHLLNLQEDELISQVEEDRMELSRLVGYEVVGMAYPYGDYTPAIAHTIATKTGVQYARITLPTDSFALPQNLLCWYPNAHHSEEARIHTLLEQFLSSPPDQPQVLSIWGHSYEFDRTEHGWERLENLCRQLSGHPDVFYGTNREVFGI